jgi:hypothetical protein
VGRQITSAFFLLLSASSEGSDDLEVFKPRFRSGQFCLRVLVGMKKLPVDLDELALALESNDSGYDLGVYWFDTSTGDVLFVSSDLEEDEELRDQIAENAPGRFVRIDSIDSRAEFRMMEDFVRTLPPGQARDTLESSLRGPRPFRQFKDSLNDKKVRERWFAFRREAVRHSAITWLAELGIRAE